MKQCIFSRQFAINARDCVRADNALCSNDRPQENYSNCSGISRVAVMVMLQINMVLVDTNSIGSNITKITKFS